MRIYAGDLNDCPNPLVDRKNQSSSSRVTHWGALLDAVGKGVVDAVRQIHRTRASFTRPHRGKDKSIISWSRIDLILVPSRWRKSILNASTLFDAPSSDHRPVTVSLRLPQPPPTSSSTLPSSSSFLRRINARSFTDPRFEESLAEAVDRVLLSPLGPAAAWEAEKARLVAYSSQLSRDIHLERAAAREAHVERLAWLESLSALSPAQQRDWTTSMVALQQLSLEEARLLRVRAHVPALDSEEGHSTLGSPPTTDINIALDYTHHHFQSHFARAGGSEEDRRSAQDDLLDVLRSSSPKSDARFSRRMREADANSLAAPFEQREVLRAIESADLGRSPGPSGLPYEFYRSYPVVTAKILTAVFNDVWEKRSLTPSMADARVRLLPKVKKVGFDASFLGHYRPVTLRETDYKILSKVLVSRLNPILPSILPSAQHGFVPSRRSADAATHLSLLIEEVQAQGFSEAALLSLDQASAYDKVAHDWVLLTYEAFGAPARFLELLRALYSDDLSACYIINGFLSAPVLLRVGLGQGDPLSCPSWNISFQPFLDALIRRRICLKLSTVPPLPRSEILAVLAFADDVLPCIESAKALLPLNELSAHWKLATNGEFNSSKTEALPLGNEWGAQPLSSTIRMLEEGEGLTWVGFPFSRDGDSSLTYANALDLIHRSISHVTSRPLSPSSRAHYANTYIISLILHLLSYLPPPPSFAIAVDRAILDFVWGGPYHAVRKEAVYLPRKKGGLGLISVQDVAAAGAIRLWDALAGGSAPMWRELAMASFEREVGKGGVTKTVRKFPPQLDLTRLRLPHLLLLPPSLPQLHPIPLDPLIHTILSRSTTIAALYSRRLERGGEEQLLTPPPLGLRSTSLLEWTAAAACSPLIKRELPQTANPPRPLPSPQLPPRRSFAFFELSRPTSVAELRRAIAAARYPDEQVGRKWPEGTSEKEKGEFWEWFRRGGASARERDTHWRLIYGATPVRSRLVHQERADDAFCPHCPAEIIETVEHYFFGCEWSTSLWTSLNAVFARLFLVPSPSLELTPADITLGLPSLRSSLPKTDQRALRLFVAVSLQSLHDARWAARDGSRIRDATKLAALVEERVMARLEDGD